MKNSHKKIQRKNLLLELKCSFKKIKSNYNYIKHLSKQGEELLGSSEWLLDNIYLIEKEYKSIKINLPQKYFDNLPPEGESKDEINPRIFKLAKEYIHKKEGVIEEEALIKFIKSRNNRLTMGELWAFPLMIKISLIIKLSNITERLHYIQEDKLKGKLLALEIVKSIDKGSLEEKINEIKNKENEYSPVFINSAFKVLRDNSVEENEVFLLLKSKLHNKEEEELIKNAFVEGSLESHISLIIKGLREIEGISWRNFFEKTSKVEEILNSDPQETYINMDFETKDYYRHRIEKLSKKLGVDEIVLAEKAIYLSLRAKEEGKTSCKTHVGYYLIDEGINELGKSIKQNSNLKNTYSLGGFFLLLLILTSLVVVITVYLAKGFGELSAKQNILLILLIIIPASEISLSLTNWIMGKYIPLRHVPKLDYSKGIPKSEKTIITIPVILSSKQKVREIMERLEIFYLGNRDENLYFVLLGDFKDSKEEENKEDYSIIEEGVKESHKLNKEYCMDEKKFFFLNRERIFNPKENCYMGRERKRGKLMEFISLIKGNENHSFSVISSPINRLKDAKYIITLDADTFLPRETAHKLVGAMSHILNKPVIKEGRVKRGYGIMQPKVTISLESKNKSKFSRVFGGEEGVDGYSTAYSDTYEDLFGEGSFNGKGIIDINTFYSILKDELPENRILSHDLIEGCYTRCALVTDTELIDGYPHSYEASSRRLHRWVRGDWQIGSFIFKRKLSLLSKWKIFDNLRRSLLAPSILLLILLSLSVLNYGESIVVLCFLAIIFPVIFTITDFVVTPKVKLRGTLKTIKESILILSFAPYQGILMCDAIFKTLYRLIISKKYLLQWVASEEEGKNIDNSLGRYYKRMILCPIFALVICFLAFYRSIGLGVVFFPLVILWIFSPYIAFSISLVIREEEDRLSLEETDYVRSLSRRIWAYYEDFVNEENNFLAPDNFQESPYKGVANRTSPTNIGLGLMSNITAFDLGYIPFGEVVDKLELTLNEMKTLERYEGHFLNWYDTKTKSPLWPKYVSTVDSGNLLAYLMIVKEALNEYKKAPLVREIELTSLKDGLRILGIDEENILSERFKLKDYIPLLEEALDYVKGFDFEENEEKEYWKKKIEKEIKLKMSYYDYFFESFEKLLLEDFDNRCPSILELMEHLESIISSSGEEFKELLRGRLNCLEAFLKRVDDIVEIIDGFLQEMKFNFLFNEDRGLFAIGYNLEENSRGASYYDLLASEARCASFLAIARGEVSKNHWFKLSRAMTKAFSEKCLVSWSGTMFEYFMPALIMKSYEGTLLHKTYLGVIEAQKKFGEQKKIPWGISESAYYKFDISENYQYKAFGVPGIGLKRGLEDEIVVSPYSTIMTLPFDKHDGIENLKRLEGLGACGRYGFIEAIDYTQNRVNQLLTQGVLESEVGKEVRCYMVHHLGMSILALDNLLNRDILIKRFHNIKEVKATELLLKEKIPSYITFERNESYEVKKTEIEIEEIIPRIFEGAIRENQEVLLLSNGSLSTMINLSGGGYTKKEDTMLYRWKGDSTSDNSGMFFYIKNLNSNDYWSATYEPTKNEGENYKVSFSLDKATFNRIDGSIETKTEVVVSPNDDFEVRKLTLRNIGEKARTVEVTSYMEVTLTSFESDAVHPTFSNLFITTEFDEELEMLLANRRARAKNGKSPYIYHKLVSNEEINITYETARANFIGRNRSLKTPKAMENDASLENTVGIVLDPILSLRGRVELNGGESKEIYFITGIAEKKEKAIEVATKYCDTQSLEGVFLGYSRAINLELKGLGIRSPQGNIYQTLSSYVFYLHSGRKDREAFIKNINKNQQDLWPYGISGDLPIITLVIKDENELDLLRWVVKMHYYLRIKGVKSDLVIYNEEEFSYDEPLQKNIMQIISLENQGESINKPSGIFVHNKSTMGEEIRDFLIGISVLYLDHKKGSIIKQMNQIEENLENPLRHKELSKKSSYKVKIDKKEVNIEEKERINRVFEENLKEIKEDCKFNEDELLFFNGFGGFDEGDNSYNILLKDYKSTPAPWINVISNDNFGFHISESGGSYTWYGNSRENKITPWSNDPIEDPLGEALYIRDNNAGVVFSITPEPIRDGGEYFIKHGYGYSTFKHRAYSISGEYTVFSPIDKNIKIGKVKLKNLLNKERKISIFYYAQLVLGVFNYGSRRYLNTEIKEEYIVGQNPYSKFFGEEKAYLTILGGESLSFSGDRKEFIGVGGDVSLPEALEFKELSNKVGAIYDPAMIVETKITLEPGEEKEVYILLGVEKNEENIRENIDFYKEKDNISLAFDKSKEFWRDFLGNIQVKTKDKSFDLLVNGWLLYQNLSCRYWSRTAFYQSGGAYGFRDQLQDSMALGVIKPEIMREQILRSASRQYVEGDVQHWWHPVINSGIRTRFSDDLLWLPYVTAEYLRYTGDYSILSEEVTYLEDEPLRPGEDERYTIVNKSDKKGTIYEHCIKAILRGLRFGEHNIPLMGSGDWNDGMSTVGNEGKGESVWLGWFLYSILDRFKEICAHMNDNENVKLCNENMEFIKENIEKNAWDGGWYRRAYFDDGTPLGSRENKECKIDSLAQSWAVISGAGKDERVREAMEAVDRNLVKKDRGMILLLTPPFEKSKLEPGYIKGYVAGVRENGGQYTHAAVWVILALTKLGMGDKAYKYFQMINPINHSSTEISARNYKVEPYVMAADVYIREPHGGRGGWSWYTGAAGWMYRVALENILGFRKRGEFGYEIKPCIPEDWDEFSINIKNETEDYAITVKRGEENRIFVNGIDIKEEFIPRNLGKAKIEVEFR